MNELALFAGAGGGLLASRLLGWTTVAAVERDPYRQRVIRARQADGFLEPFPLFDDVETFDGRPYRDRVDVVSAGFPCQPYSVAGRRLGERDARNGWPHTIRIIREVRPRFAWLENVPGLIGTRRTLRIMWWTVARLLFGRIRERHETTIRLPPYFARVLGDLAQAGFDAEWTVLGADDVGAPHRRKRVWILAYSTGARIWRLPIQPGRRVEADPYTLGPSARDVADARCASNEPDDRPVDALGATGATESEAPQRQRSGNAARDGGSHVSDAAIKGLEIGTRFGSDQGQELPPTVGGDSLPNPEHKRREGRDTPRPGTAPALPRCTTWDADPADDNSTAESFVGRVADGVANRVDRLAALGDGQVPAVVVRAWFELAAAAGLDPTNPLGRPLE